ncbi:MAG: GTP-binding protein, partial [Pyrinomonadaceae bacterium]|nr:GTP-binding protein [Pyrinomonadaceae bacterium]
MTQPLVAIIGRPNVGKSTLFNRITESRKSIVGDEPGITRDRIYGEVSWRAKTFELVDTGGIVPDDEAIIPANIFKQAEHAISESQAIVWVVDARAGITPLDEEIGTLLRSLGKPVFIAANKSETKKVAEEAAEFYKFGFDIEPVSAEHGTNVGDLLDKLFDALDFDTEPEEEKERRIRLAIIGRPNVGKSSILN